MCGIGARPNATGCLGSACFRKEKSDVFCHHTAGKCHDTAGKLGGRRSSDLQGIGPAMLAQHMAAAAPATGVIPAAAGSISPDCNTIRGTRADVPGGQRASCGGS
jgi:hypothetical protein